MSITKSYNRKVNITYAYDTTYEWSEEKGKRIQKRKCIGQVDPQTGKIVPNGKVGRRPISEDQKPPRVARLDAEPPRGLSAVYTDIREIKACFRTTVTSIGDLEKQVQEVQRTLGRLRIGFEKVINRKAQG